MKILFFYFEKSTALHIFPDIVLLLQFLSCKLVHFFLTNAVVIIIFIIIVLLSFLPAYCYNDLNYIHVPLYRAIADTYTGRLLFATENTIEYSR